MKSRYIKADTYKPILQCCFTKKKKTEPIKSQDNSKKAYKKTPILKSQTSVHKQQDVL